MDSYKLEAVVVVRTVFALKQSIRTRRLLNRFSRTLQKGGSAIKAVISKNVPFYPEICLAENYTLSINCCQFGRISLSRRFWRSSSAFAPLTTQALHACRQNWRTN